MHIHTEFLRRKAVALQNLYAGVDKSPKGSVDAPIADLVGLLNTLCEYVTTSSCSGRISVYECSWQRSAPHVQDKGIRWLLVQHTPVELQNVLKCMQECMASERQLDITLKHEPFVLHVDCRDTTAARRLLQVALKSGFRESGIVWGKRVMLAVRSTALIMDCPLVRGGMQLLTEAGLEVILREANTRLQMNLHRVEALLLAIKQEFLWGSLQTVTEHAGLIRRWAHGCVPLNRSQPHMCLVLGGYGEDSTHRSKRLLHPLTLDLHNLRVLPVEFDSSVAPCTREHLAACMLDPLVVLFGGRQSPMAPLSDTWSFDYDTCRFTPLCLDSADMPSARWGHSLTAFGTRSALLFGGRNAVHVLRDSFILTLNDDGVGQWSLVDSGNGPTPPSRFFHAACSVAENVLIHGGLAAIESTNAFADLWLFTTHRAWERVSLTSTLPFFAHSISHVGARSLLIFGGVSFQQAEGAESLLSPVILIDLISVFDGQGWSTRGLRRDAEMAVLPDDAALVMHHQAVVTETGVLIVGGGCSCLGLGPAFAPSLTLQLHTPHTTQGQVYTPVEPTDADEHGMSEVSDTHLQAVLLCAAAHVKRLKVLLESYAWLDKQKRITSADADAIDTVQEIDTVKRVWGGVYDSLRASPLRDEVTLKALPLCRNASEALRRLDREMLETLAEAGFLRLFMSSQSTPTSKVLHISPSLRAHTLLSQLRAEHGIPDRDGKDLPRHFELIGDVLMIPEDALLGPWDALGSSLWAEIAKCFGVQRVARKARIAPTGTRDSCITLLWPQQSHEEMGPGSAGWVQIRENGVLFAFDITKVMFCSGNNTERMRMGALHAQGETVADLYCGIGYYTLPLLVHAGAHFVHAFEWNPHSLLALRHNLEANGVSSRCKIYEGDNREQAPTIGRIAHRILLGLLPSSKDGWPLAVRLLREEGGWIHVHGNTLDEERDVWVRDVLNEFEALAEAQQRRWMIECVHVERVKSYAPYVGHYVVDLRCDAFVVEGKADAH